MLTQEDKLAGLAALNRDLIAKAEAIDSPRRVVLDMDSTEIPVYGEPEQSSYNGHLESTCYHPLLLFNREGDCLAAKLRPGTVHSAVCWEELLLPEIERQRARGKEVVFRGDATFARPELYEALEERDVNWAIRLRANDHPQRNTRELLTRPVGRPSRKPVFRLKSFLYQARELDDSPASGGAGRVPLRGVVSPRRLYRDQFGARQPGCGTLLQQAQHGRTMDQGNQAGGRADAA